MPQYQKRKIHPHSEEDLVGSSEGLKIVIWDKTEYTTIVLKSGDAAILPHNTWHSPLPNDEVSGRNLGDYAETVVSNKDSPPW